MPTESPNEPKRRLSPGVALLLIAPVLGELVSGHQKPLDFFNPLVFLLMALPYGFGAVLARELVVRWGKGWPSLLLLGLAYGLYEEGVVVRSFLNPDWHELGELAHNGTFAGVNWPYAQLLLHFHVLISIVASVLLAGVLYPQRRRQPWLGARAFTACTIGLALWLPVGWLLTSHRPPMLHYTLVCLAVPALVVAARFAPMHFRSPGDRPPPRPWVFFTLGLVNMTLFFVGVFAVAEQGLLSLPAIVGLLCMVDIVGLWLVLRLSDEGRGWGDRHRLAWIAGLLGFFIFFGVMQDLEAFSGRSLVAVAAVIALWRIHRRVATREGQAAAAAGKL